MLAHFFLALVLIGNATKCGPGFALAERIAKDEGYDTGRHPIPSTSTPSLPAVDNQALERISPSNNNNNEEEKAAFDLVALHPSPLRPRKLHGRFLHLTDIHPDEYYVYKAAVSQQCHRRKPKRGKGRAGWWGVPYSDCDSPITLLNLTMDYLHKEWSEQIDFVIWTGDSARHDNDNKIPRTPSAIYQMNRNVAQKMIETFPNIPIVPNIGNNDIWPHNVMAPGPNRITNEYSSIWRPFIPFSSYQVFQRGGYFSTEVIPNHVAVISLNTMYWYDANKAVGGCELHSESDPGNLQFDWLDVQLQRYRERGMQVILMGHVPPTPGNYFPDCHFRYGQISIRYQDTIIGHFFGHMNVDHFFWIDVHDLAFEPTDPKEYENVPDDPMHVQKSVLHEDLREDFQNIPEELHHSDYVIVNVGPSIIPAYLPSFRVYQYNITLYQGPKAIDEQAWDAESWAALKVDEDEDEEEDIYDDEAVTTPRPRKRSIYSQRVVEKRIGTARKRRHRHRHPEKPDCDLPENKDKYACRPWGPRHASPTSPSRTNTLWSLLGYAQYYMPDLGEATKKKPPKFRLEYVTQPIGALHPPNTTDANAAKKRKWIPPVPKHLLPKSLREPNRTSSKFTPYELEDLTIGRWIDLARRLGSNKKMWKKFLGFMYMGEEVDEKDWEVKWGVGQVPLQSHMDD